MLPEMPRGFVIDAVQNRDSSRPGRSARTTPSMSATTTSFAPAASSSLSTAVPAAPAPDSTIRTVARSLPTTLSALVSAATTTIAVPCWSSWNTGMSSRSRSRRSISKQRGAEMSSRLIPANTGAIAQIVSHDLVHVGGVQRDRERVDPREPLEQHRLALHDRQAGQRPDVAEPQHRGAVGDHRDRVALDGQAARVLRVGRDGLADARDARRVRHRQVVAVAQRHLRLDRELAAEVHEERAVADAVDDHAVQALAAPRRCPRRAARPASRT